MNPVTFPLRQTDTGAAFSDSHQVLITLAYTIDAAEVKDRRFCANTKAAVSQFQTNHNLTVQATVNQDIAEAIKVAPAQAPVAPTTLPSSAGIRFRQCLPEKLFPEQRLPTHRSHNRLPEMHPTAFRAKRSNSTAQPCPITSRAPLALPLGALPELTPAFIPVPSRNGRIQ